MSRQFIQGPDYKCYDLVNGRYGDYYEQVLPPSNIQFCINADVHYRRNKLTLTGSCIDILPSLDTKIDAYKKFENHTLPRLLEKKIARLIPKGRIIYGSDATVQEG